jgi:hypothetical protein
MDNMKLFESELKVMEFVWEKRIAARYMKRIAIIVAMVIIPVIFVGCSKMDKEHGNLAGYVSYSTLQEDYSLEDAKKDGCVVFEDLHLTSGEEHWLRFVDITKKGEPASIRLAYYYTLEAQKGHVSDELYEEIKDEYPCLYFTDLIYDGAKFTTYYVEEGKEYIDKYVYLNHYTGDARKGANFSKYDCYILVNDQNVTYDELERALYSSNFNDGIDSKRIYTNHIK